MEAKKDYLYNVLFNYALWKKFVALFKEMFYQQSQKFINQMCYRNSIY